MDTQLWARALVAAADVLNGASLGSPVRETKVVPKVSKKAAALVEDEGLTEDDLGDEVEETETETDWTAEDVMLAFKKFIGNFGDVKKGRLEAKKVLKKLKVEKIADLEVEDYEKVLGLLK